MWTAHECQVIIPYYVSPFPQIFPLSLSLFTHLPSPLSLFQAPPRVFFKTGVIDIETLIRCRHLWLTATITGGEAGEKKDEGLGFSIKRHKTILSTSRSSALQNRCCFQLKRRHICVWEGSYSPCHAEHLLRPTGRHMTNCCSKEE